MKKILFIFTLVLSLVSTSASAVTMTPYGPVDSTGFPLDEKTGERRPYLFNGGRDAYTDEHGIYYPAIEASVPFNTGTQPAAGTAPIQGTGPLTGIGSNGSGGTGASSYNSNISSACQLTDLDSISKCILTIINTLLYFLMSGALLLTVWASFKLVRDGDSDDKRSAAKHQIVAGIFALVIMSSIWGLVAIVSSTFGLTNRSPVAPPQISI